MNRSRKEKPAMNSSFANKIKAERSLRKNEFSESNEVNRISASGQPLLMSTPKQITRSSKPLEQTSNLNHSRNLRKKEFSESSDVSRISVSGKPLLMSTPKQPTRFSNTLEQSSNLSRSRSVLSQSGSTIQKKFHPNYDPNIEIRQVHEREGKRLSTSWADQSLRNDEEEADLQRYTEKCKKTNKNERLEKDTDVLARRQGQIDMGKVKQCYKNYVYEIGKTERKLFMPKTPNKFMVMSRRGWDGMVRKWKKHIHAWNEPNFEELYKTGMEFDCCSESSMSIKTSLDHSDDNLSRQDDLFSVKDEPVEEEETLQGAKSSRKRGLSPVVFDKENCDEDTIEKFPVMRDSRLRDLHTGLTNDAAALTVAPVKRQRMSGAGK